MFDAIVVGARCAGSPTAMLLARRGYRVLLLDRARFPSDTISTHWIWPPGVACLKRWGLLDRVVASNCPPIRSLGLDLGAFVLTGVLPAVEGVDEMYAPRRTVLDKLLLDAAAEAGAEVREGFAVTGLDNLRRRGNRHSRTPARRARNRGASPHCDRCGRAEFVRRKERRRRRIQCPADAQLWLLHVLE